MTQNLKYQFLSIYQKLKCEIRLRIDDRSIWTSHQGDIDKVSLQIPTYIGISIDRPDEIDSNGVRTRVPWNINDQLTMTKFNLPIFIRELKAIQDDLKIPEMYSYTGERLELNAKLASNSRRVFMINKTTLELTLTVVSQRDQSDIEQLVEGVKLKFNNETSSVLLTLNELDSLVYNLDKLDIDSVALTLFSKYANPTSNSRQVNQQQPIVVDIV